MLNHPQSPADFTENPWYGIFGKSQNPMPNNNQNIRPEWGDAKTVKFLFGLSKTTLYRLASEGKIKSCSLRERGKLRGKRLFSCDSVAAHIEKLAASVEP